MMKRFQSYHFILGCFKWENFDPLSPFYPSAPFWVEFLHGLLFFRILIVCPSPVSVICLELNCLPNPGRRLWKRGQGERTLVLPGPPKLLRCPRISELNGWHQWPHFTEKGTKVDCGATGSRSHHQFGAAWTLEPRNSLTAWICERDEGCWKQQTQKHTRYHVDI